MDSVAIEKRRTELMQEMARLDAERGMLDTNISDLVSKLGLSSTPSLSEVEALLAQAESDLQVAELDLQKHLQSVEEWERKYADVTGAGSTQSSAGVISSGPSVVISSGPSVDVSGSGFPQGSSVTDGSRTYPPSATPFRGSGSFNDDGF